MERGGLRLMVTLPPLLKKIFNYIYLRLYHTNLAQTWIGRQIREVAEQNTLISPLLLAMSVYDSRSNNRYDLLCCCVC